MKYKVNKGFIDSQDGCKAHYAGDVITLTKKRAKEVREVLGESALEEVDEDDK